VKINSIILEEVSEEKISITIDLANEIWLETYPSFISLDQINFMLKNMYNKDVILNEIKNGIKWFLIKENSFIGFISYSLNDTKNIKIMKFYILTEYQQQGIGKKVFSFIKDLAKNERIDKIILNVNRYNVKAIQAYRNWGLNIGESVDIIYGKYILNDYVMEYTINL
jgi:diamine N-acetyltransferase